MLTDEKKKKMLLFLRGVNSTRLVVWKCAWKCWANFGTEKEKIQTKDVLWYRVDVQNQPPISTPTQSERESERGEEGENGNPERKKKTNKKTIRGYARVAIAKEKKKKEKTHKKKKKKKQRDESLYLPPLPYSVFSFWLANWWSISYWLIMERKMTRDM